MLGHWKNDLVLFFLMEKYKLYMLLDSVKPCFMFLHIIFIYAYKRINNMARILLILCYF